FIGTSHGRPTIWQPPRKLPRCINAAKPASILLDGVRKKFSTLCAQPPSSPIPTSEHPQCPMQYVSDTATVKPWLLNTKVQRPLRPVVLPQTVGSTGAQSSATPL